MRKRGAERLGVGSLRDVAGAVDAQALLLEAGPPPGERGRAEGFDETAQAAPNDVGQAGNLREGTGTKSERGGFCAISVPIASARRQLASPAQHVRGERQRVTTSCNPAPAATRGRQCREATPGQGPNISQIRVRSRELVKYWG